jgi:hypothetical protein
MLVNRLRAGLQLVNEMPQFTLRYYQFSHLFIVTSGNGDASRLDISGGHNYFLTFDRLNGKCHLSDLTVSAVCIPLYVPQSNERTGCHKLR